MTRISTDRFARLAGGLLVVALAGSASAQEAADRYARTLAEADITARYNTQIEQQVRSQQAEIASLEQQIAGLDATAVDVQPLIQRMFDELVQFVGADLPFMQDERSARIERLRELMARVDATTSEKFRRLLEAYQIEMEYGRTTSWYTGTLADGREAEFVRIGRVTLMYRTVDGSDTGYWDNQQKTWVADRDDSRAIEEALGMAKEERAPDLVIVPVPAPQGERS
jgi:hypothetical protein